MNFESRRPSADGLAYQRDQGDTMDLFAKLLDTLLVLHEVLGIPVVSKEVLSQRTDDYPQPGGGLRPQSQNSDGMGRERPPQGGPRAASTAPDREARGLRRLLHLQKHGTGPHLPHHCPEVPTQDPHLPAGTGWLPARFSQAPLRNRRSAGCRAKLSKPNVEVFLFTIFNGSRTTPRIAKV